MKLTMKLLVLFFGVLMLGHVAYAQTPREQFQTTVAAFQKNATEDTARKLAELFKQLNPPPAVPEHAEFCALKGAAFVKQAGDATDYAKAAAEFQAAIAAAPWVGDYHYNLAVCEKSAGRFSAAQTAIKFAQIFARDDKERHDCLALRAELEAAQELATAKKANDLTNFRIVPGKSIGPVSLGMSAADVLKIMGPPERRSGYQDLIGVYRSGTMGIVISPTTGLVTNLFAWKGDYTTDDGVKLGLPISSVDKKLGTPTEIEDYPGDTPRGQCYLINGGAMWVWMSKKENRVLCITVVPGSDYR